MDIQVPDYIFRMEIFKDSKGVWCASLKYQDKYATGETPQSACDNAIKSISICKFTNSHKDCSKCNYPALCD